MSRNNSLLPWKNAFDNASRNIANKSTEQMFQDRQNISELVEQNKSNSNNAHTGYVKTDIDKLKKQIKAYPKSANIRSSLGYSKKTDAKKFDANMNKNCYINTFSLKNWLKSEGVKAALLKGMADEILNEFDFGDIEPDNVEFPKACT